MTKHRYNPFGYGTGALTPLSLTRSTNNAFNTYIPGEVNYPQQYTGTIPTRTQTINNDTTATGDYSVPEEAYVAKENPIDLSLGAQYMGNQAGLPSIGFPDSFDLQTRGVDASTLESFLGDGQEVGGGRDRASFAEIAPYLGLGITTGSGIAGILGMNRAGELAASNITPLENYENPYSNVIESFQYALDPARRNATRQETYARQDINQSYNTLLNNLDNSFRSPSSASNARTLAEINRREAGMDLNQVYSDALTQIDTKQAELDTRAQGLYAQGEMYRQQMDARNRAQRQADIDSLAQQQAAQAQSIVNLGSSIGGTIAGIGKSKKIGKLLTGGE